MTNVRFNVSKDEETGERVLQIEIALDHEAGLTSSGKAISVATTNGWIPLDEDPNVAISLNIIRKKDRGHWRKK